MVLKQLSVMLMAGLLACGTAHAEVIDAGADGRALLQAGKEDPAQLLATPYKDENAGFRISPPEPGVIEGRTKVVPIIKIGSSGLAIGAAQVMGPEERVNLVRAVAS